ncbi:MAG: ABC transporter permease subunit/CPBP intramembrane protease [Pirellula sp.]
MKLIFQREIRDQLRDRRTMFTIFFLPLLLYPLMGMLMFEVAQFHRDGRVTIGIVGSSHIQSELPLLSEDSNAKVDWKTVTLDESLVCRLAEYEAKRKDSQSEAVASSMQQEIEALLKSESVDAIAIIPSQFATEPWNTPIKVICNQRWERSVQAAVLFQARITSTHQSWIRQKLAASSDDEKSLDEPQLNVIDVAPPAAKRSLIWSKILPFVMLVWALTGAFYPAIDLCAGEKERGTLETLLCSPARRREIVWGKLLTVMCFSLGTALLNLFSMYTTALVVVNRFADSGVSQMAEAMGPLPIRSMGWLILLVVPIATMFSAIALAVASLARSTKEGQYYLMPLMLVGMPLVMLPMIPGVTLSPGTCIIPITGAVLLSKTLMDGEYMNAILYLPTVIAVTVFCILLATRWAIRQFESESVMFRDSARSSLKQWLRDAWRQRGDTPTANESLLCGLLILVCLFFGRLSMSTSQLAWETIVSTTLVIQLGMMLGPALIMATMLTKSVIRSLRLTQPSWVDLASMVLLAGALHPSYTVLAAAISNEYRLGEETTSMLQQFDGLLASAPIGGVILILALLPAISEELVFRGFLFSGLQRNNGHVRAILATSLLFGLSHGVLQQSITASIMGLLLGWIAYKTGGVVCSIVFHFVHNSISMLLATHGSRGDAVPVWMEWAISTDQGHWAYSDLWCTLSVGVSICLIAWLASRQPQSPGMGNERCSNVLSPNHSDDSKRLQSFLEKS